MRLAFLIFPRKQTFNYDIKNKQEIKLTENQIVSEAELPGITYFLHRSRLVLPTHV